MANNNYPRNQDVFQSAQQGTKQAADAYADMDPHSPDYGRQVTRVMQEVNEALQQIQKASAYASEHQKEQLGQYLDQLQTILGDINDSQL